MKNFTRGGGKSSIIGQIPENTPFTKAKEFIGEYKQGEMIIKGILKTFSEKFGKNQYSLLILKKKDYMFMDVPEWYGESVYDDFMDSPESAAEYFNCSISSIEEFETKYNTKSVDIKIYE